MLEVKELLELFVTFFKIRLVSFGGGFAMLSLIDREVSAHHWLEAEKFVDVIAVAGIAPGPIATNRAILVGYNVAGIAGAAATRGMVLPSLHPVFPLSGISPRSVRLLRAETGGCRSDFLCGGYLRPPERPHRR